MCIHIYIYIYIYIYRERCTHIHTYIHTYMYTHIIRLSSSIVSAHSLTKCQQLTADTRE